MISSNRLLIAVTAVCAFSAAQLSAATLFTGYYNVANWTTTIFNNHTPPDLSGAPNSITLTASNQVADVTSSATFTIAAPAAGTVSFNWAWAPGAPPARDAGTAGYILNGIRNQLTTPSLSQNSSASFLVNPGDIFGFWVAEHGALDGFGGTFTVSNGSAPSPAAVPEPGSVPLVAGGLLLGLAFKKRGTRQPRLQ